MIARSVLGLGIVALTTSCVGTTRADPSLGAARLSLVVPPPTRIRASAAGGPSAALLAKAPAPAVADALVVTPAAPFVENAAVPDAQRALDCLTQAVYYEARSEPVDGQRAVAQVVINRVHNPAYSNSVCGTVYEGSRRSTGCQFSFTCDGSLARRREPSAWARAAEVAGAALAGFVYAPVGTATYYHTTAIHPWWAAKVTHVATIGAHIFYRLPGSWGGLGAFSQRYAGAEPILTGGRHIAPKSIDAIVQTIEAGVTVHRGSSIAEATTPSSPSDAAETTVPVAIPAAFVAGVDIHRGTPPTGAGTGHGVTIHRNAGVGLASITR
ncbi:cell wall hydrolase [Sphingomonas oligophenolica]|uniref:cell wall hydrolase n=1 Tax=Sphingomonas oligophenolica TaxID=301154 RepID=UPI0019D545F9|nr:cell wall hydrolase [Sphingomonas oligophenolica]